MGNQSEACLLGHLATSVGLHNFMLDWHVQLLFKVPRYQPVCGTGLTSGHPKSVGQTI